jgi:DNA polymerase-3 subunit epsilon
MILVGIDFETTGLDPAVDKIIEIGAALWDTDRKMPLRMLSCYVNPECEISQEITEITGITNGDLAIYGLTKNEAFRELIDMESFSDHYFMAHNAEFDKGFYKAALGGASNEDAVWLCSKNDIVYPDKITTRNLRHLAAEHGFLNPLAHRALFDVMTMLMIASRYDINAMIARAKERTLYVQALVSFDDREKAKGKGYYWHGPKKIWWRTFKESEYEKEKDSCGFRTVVLAGSPEAK